MNVERKPDPTRIPQDSARQLADAEHALRYAKTPAERKAAQAFFDRALLDDDMMRERAD